jgi:exodeoxyribonuclease X
MTSIVLFDTETTGIQGSRVIQLAYKRFEMATMKEVSRKNMFFKPPVPISLGAMATHHITEEAVANEEPFEVVRQPVQSLINTCIMVAHNAQFDMKTLENEGVDVSEAQTICTYKLALQLFPDFESHTLQYLRYALKADKPEFHEMNMHDARSDVEVLESVFTTMLWHMIDLDPPPANEAPHDTLPARIEKMVKMCTGPMLLPRMRFGKHKGKGFDEVKLIDTGYLQWLLEAEEKKALGEQDENLVHTIRHHLNMKARK